MLILLNFFVFFNGKRVQAGTLGKDMVFRKKVKLRDKLYKHMAFGQDKSYIDDVLACGAERIELTVSDNNQVYEIDVVTFKEHAVLDKVGKFSNRFYCPLEYWKHRKITTKKGVSV